MCGRASRFHAVVHSRSPRCVPVQTAADRRASSRTLPAFPAALLRRPAIPALRRIGRRETPCAGRAASPAHRGKCLNTHHCTSGNWGETDLISAETAFAPPGVCWFISNGISGLQFASRWALARVEGRKAMLGEIRRFRRRLRRSGSEVVQLGHPSRPWVTLRWELRSFGRGETRCAFPFSRADRSSSKPALIAKPRDRVRSHPR